MYDFFKYSIFVLIISFILLSNAFGNEYNLHLNSFIENKGQLQNTYNLTPNNILYYYGNHNLKAYFHKNGIIYVFQSQNKNEFEKLKSNNYLMDNGQREITTYSTALTFAGCNPNPEIIALEPSETLLNFFYPHCPQGILSVRSFKILKYENIYPDIDLMFYSGDIHTGFKYDFIVKPGGNPSDIKIACNSPSEINITENGSLEIKNLIGFIEENAPIVYQFNNSQIKLSAFDNKNLSEKMHCKIDLASKHLYDSVNIKIIPSKFKISGNIIHFEISNYDRVEQLIIDPDIKWATYFGGGDGDLAKSVVIDKNDDIIIHGWSISLNLPVSNDAYQKYRGGIFDSFVAKFDAFGKLLWATYFGGLDTDYGQDVCVDNGRNIYLTGFTWSQDFPVTIDAIQTVFGGGSNAADGFIAKFNPDGERLWATYYGGFNSDHFYGVAINDKDELALTGWTKSFNFLRSSNSPPLNFSGFEDAFVVRLSSSGAFISSYIHGGSGVDWGQDVAYDNFGNIIITGITDSKNFPLDPKPLTSEDRAFIEKKDIFITKFNNDDSSSFIEFSYVFGGSENDEGYALSLDNTGNIYLTGMTESTNLKVTNNVFQKTKSALSDAFVMKLNKFGKLLWSTFLGGSKRELGYNIRIDPFLNVVVCGKTESPDFPVSKGAGDKDLSGNSDAFVTKLNMSGDKLLWSTFLGGSKQEDAFAIAIDRLNHIVAAGSTESPDFPVVFNPVQDSLSGNYDAFLLKLCANEPEPVINVIGNRIICPGDSVILDAGPQWQWYRWNNGSTTRRLIVKSKGYYYVIVTDTNSCTGNSDSIFIDVYNPEKPVFTGEKGFCKGDSTTIGILQDYISYNWSNNKKTKNITVNKEGWYYITLTDKNDCKIYDSVRVVQYRDPQPKIRGQKIVCRESKKVVYFVSGIASEKYFWKVEGGTLDYGTDSVNIYVDWGPAGIGKIYVKAVDYLTGCIGYDSLTVIISDHLEPEISSSNNSFDLCQGDSLILDAGSGYDIYRWNDGSTERFLKVKSAGIYWVYVADTIGCEGRDTVSVSVHPNPAPEISGINNICEFSRDITYQTPDVTGNSYVWSITGGTITNGNGTSQITVDWNSAGIGNVQVLEKNETTGCHTLSEILHVLIYKNPSPSISIIGQKEFCEGDSVQLIAQSGFNKYNWSNGATSPSIWVKQSGIYWVVVTDINGCTGSSSDSILIVVQSIPEKPLIIRINDTLYSSSGNNFQWYLNGNPVPGATNSSYYPEENGIYKVVVSNDFGCWNESEPFDYWRGIGKITIALPDTIFAPTGTMVNIPLNIIESLYLRKVEASDYIGYLSYNSTILLPFDENIIYTNTGSEKQFKFSGSLSDTLGLLRQFQFFTAWGNSQCSPITLDSIIWNVKNIETHILNGTFCLNDICFAAGRRLYFDSDLIELKQNIPNPFENVTEIEYSVIEKAPTQLFIADLMGRKLFTLFNDIIEPGRYLVKFDAEMLSQGIYLYILQTPTKILTRRMEIIK